MITTPTKPRITLPSRLFVMRSPSTRAASNATQCRLVVNSSENTIANGQPP